MKRIFFKILVGIIFISLCLIIYMINTNPLKSDDSIDLTGSNNFWKASLNINLKYDSELIIYPRRDDFNIPSEININIFVNKNCVYSGRLKYIPDSNKKLLGKYKISLISNYYFKEDINNVYIIIKYNNKSSSIALN